MITGRCECGKVQYQTVGELVDFCHCHCSICRRLHGAAFVSWGGVKRDQFSYLSGESELKSYAFSENADSLFCSHCGSTLLVDYKPDADMLYLVMGAVNEDVECPKGFHQFVGSKASWVEVNDELPQFDEWPDNE
ncbi:MAG: GFA family protein [bacterium]